MWVPTKTRLQRQCLRCITRVICIGPGDERCAQGSGGETWGKETVGETRRRWEDNIKMDLQEVGGGFGDWMELAQDRDSWWALVNTVMNLRVPKNAGNFLASCRTS